MIFIKEIFKKNRYQSIKISHAIKNNKPVVIVGQMGSGKTTITNQAANRFSKNIIHITNVNEFIKSNGEIKSLIEFSNKNKIATVLIEAQNFEELEPIYKDLKANKFIFVTM